MRLKAFLILILTTTLGPYVHAHEAEIIECPQRITPDLVTRLTSTSTHWVAREIKEMPDGSDSLRGAALFSGPPVEMAELIPDNSKDHTDIWLNLDNDFYKTRHFWVGCHYKKNSVELYREVQIHPSKCLAFVKKGARKTDMLIKFTCSN